jgi:hypothetical protein
LLKMFSKYFSSFELNPCVPITFIKPNLP